jgi:hypothetical protein
LASTIAAKPFGCDEASGAEGRGGSDRTDELALDSDATLNTGTSAHETETPPARNRPIGVKQKIVLDQLHIRSTRSLLAAINRRFLPGGKICRC